MFATPLNQASPVATAISNEYVCRGLMGLVMGGTAEPDALRDDLGGPRRSGLTHEMSRFVATASWQLLATISRGADRLICLPINLF
jgi:hypothetical protein